jgi:hypothetical protein
MGALLADEISKIANSHTGAAPALAMTSVAGSPSYIYAWKADDNTVHLSGVGAIANAKTDAAPALAVVNVFLVETLYLVWKDAGSNAVKVRQYAIAEDGFPVQGKWISLPTTGNGPGDPAVTTDTTPALAVGANNQLYIVWKQPGAAAEMSWSMYDGAVWTTPATIPVAKTSTAPALAGFNTSGPNDVYPLVLGWKGANDDHVLWASFTPGATTLTQNILSGAATDAAPALAAGPTLGASYIAWKIKGAPGVSFAQLGTGSADVVTQLPQIATKSVPAMVNRANNTSGFGAQVFNDLILAWTGASTSEVWTGTWSILPSAVATPSNGLGSSSNYIFAQKDGKPMLDVSVAIDMTADIVADIGFGFQLNGYSPPGKKVNWQQYFVSFQPATAPSMALNVFIYVNNWIAPSASFVLIYASPGFAELPSNKLPAGYKLTITLQNESSSGNINGVIATLLDDKGKTVGTHTVHLDKVDLSTGPKTTSKVLASDKDFAPVLAYQLDFVGPIGAKNAVLSSGAGNITYSASNDFEPWPKTPNFVSTTFIPTGETANSIYGVLPNVQAKRFTQSFASVASG